MWLLVMQTLTVYRPWSGLATGNDETAPHSSAGAEGGGLAGDVPGGQGRA